MPTVARVLVTAPRKTIAVGEKLPVSAAPLDLKDRRVSKAVRFAVDKPTRATIERVGTGEAMLTALAPGVVRVDATAGSGENGVSGHLRVTVVQTAAPAVTPPPPAPVPAPPVVPSTAPVPAPAPAPVPAVGIDAAIIPPAGTPTTAAGLVALELVGATLTAEASAALGGAFAEYERAFGPAADTHWNAVGSKWEENYYDRGQVYFAQWVRTGNPEFYRRAVLTATTYRREYLEPGDYNASPHWSQLEGLYTHAALTGDPASRVAVASTADALSQFLAFYEPNAIDCRITARALVAQCYAARLEARMDERRRWVDTRFPSDWRARIDAALPRILAAQRPDGSFDMGASWGHAQANFMVGLLLDALIYTHTHVRADPGVPVFVRRACEYLWTTQWDAERAGFRYLDRPRTPEEANIATDLTGLLVAPFGWIYAQSGDAADRARGDAVFAGMVRGAFLHGSKQFNQAYALSYRYTGYRAAGDARTAGR